MNKESPLYSDTTPKMLHSIVCFADILGFSQLSQEAIKAGNGDIFLNKLSTALAKAYERIRARSNLWGNSKCFEIKVFTDNIVVGYPVALDDLGKGEAELGTVFTIFSEFQAALLMEGFLVRGGISFGSHYMSKDIVFGDALLDAVAQDKAGGPPCISLTSSAIDMVRRHLGFYVDPDWAPQSYYLLEDSDGTVYINYLEQAFIAYPDGGIFFNVIEAHRDTIIRGLSKYGDKPGIVSKYEWAARYHNFVCEEFVKDHPIPTSPDADELVAAAATEAQKLADYLIDVTKYSSKPKKLTLKPIKPTFRQKT